MMHPRSNAEGCPRQGYRPPQPSPPRQRVTHFPPMAPGPAQPQGFLSCCGQLAPPAKHTSHHGGLMFGLC